MEYDSTKYLVQNEQNDKQNKFKKNINLQWTTIEDSDDSSTAPNITWRTNFKT